MKYVIILAVSILLIAHQDYWNWDNPSMVWGLLPVGLFYHVIISLLAALLWLLTVTLAWPASFSEGHSKGYFDPKPAVGTPGERDE